MYLYPIRGEGEENLRGEGVVGSIGEGRGGGEVKEKGEEGKWRKNIQALVLWLALYMPMYAFIYNS